MLTSVTAPTRRPRCTGRSRRPSRRRQASARGGRRHRRRGRRTQPRRDRLGDLFQERPRCVGRVPARARRKPRSSLWPLAARTWCWPWSGPSLRCWAPQDEPVRALSDAATFRRAQEPAGYGAAAARAWRRSARPGQPRLHAAQLRQGRERSAIAELLIAAGAQPTERNEPLEHLVPVLSVASVAASIDYYVNKLGFRKLWIRAIRRPSPGGA